MKYIALLRGINVGGNRRVEMKKLKELCHTLGFSAVSTYVNSGNLIFETDQSKNEVCSKLVIALQKEFGFVVPTLVKTFSEMQAIAAAIPSDWENDAEYRADVAYLFPEIDSEKILDELSLRREYVDVRYVSGALLWHLDRKNYNRSYLNKLIGQSSYQCMTVRNVNTARYLAHA